MKRWHELELDYAARLRKASREERARLYPEAYAAVSAVAMAEMPSDPEKRTAGTSHALVEAIGSICRATDDVLEIGCGRGYTCLHLARLVRSIVGTDVSQPVLDEAESLLRQNGIGNVDIRYAAADALVGAFGERRFDAIISIDVYEHLHPEDGLASLKQCYELLHRGGKLIVVTPNRIGGPHDMTTEVYPDATEALGFHLNETTHRDLIAAMRQAGFSRFRTLRVPKIESASALPHEGTGKTFPAVVNVGMEWLACHLGTRALAWRALHRLLRTGQFLPIRLVGHRA